LALIIVSATDLYPAPCWSTGQINIVEQKLKHFPWLVSEKSFGGSGPVPAPYEIIVNRRKRSQFPAAESKQTMVA
jgi:hypothetical protein